ncbi:MAG: 30S ribosomal protein S5 [Candidatus Falkowbacteria bacterium]|nr:MAG: 30S ribosomal protein S5 [Candidatus Falkowbacteria bacterium]
MSEDKKVKTSAPKVDVSAGAAATAAKDIYGDKKQRGPRGPRRGDKRDEKRDEFEQRILEVARVTRVMAGGKRMNFRACVAIGDKKGNVGVGLGKGADVTMAVNKAVNRAKKTMINVPMYKETIPHEIHNKMGAAKIMLKPAKQGRGVISGGVTRTILELAGVKNVTTKTLGTNNKINNARCTIEALALLRKSEKKADAAVEAAPKA